MRQNKLGGYKRCTEKKQEVDWSGIEPETFRMRSERDTPTPPARRRIHRGTSRLSLIDDKLGIYNFIGGKWHQKNEITFLSRY